MATTAGAGAKADRRAVARIVAEAAADPATRDGVLAAAARTLTGRDVDPDYRGGFELDRPDPTPATPVDARGIGAWTKLATARPRDGEACLTFPHRSDCGHYYALGSARDTRQVTPYDGRSFLVFPRHPDDGGPDIGTWATLEGADYPGDARVLLYPSRAEEGWGCDPYCVTGGAFRPEAALAQGYLAFMTFPASPDDDEEEVTRLRIVEHDGWREAVRHGGFAGGLERAVDVLEEAGMAEAAALLRTRFEGRFGGDMLAEEGCFSPSHRVMALVRGDDDRPLEREVAFVDGGEAVLRPLPFPEDAASAALVARVPGERVPLARCFVHDGALLARLAGSPGRMADLWEAERAAGRLVGIAERAVGPAPSRAP